MGFVYILYKPVLISRHARISNLNLCNAIIIRELFKCPTLAACKQARIMIGAMKQEYVPSRKTKLNLLCPSDHQ